MQQKEDIWPGIWKALESYGTVKLSGDQISFTVDEEKALDLALAHRIQTSSIFAENSRSAQKQGWDWSGDTDVSIYSFTAPSVEQVNPPPPPLSSLLFSSVSFFNLRRCQGTRSSHHYVRTHKRLWNI